MHHLSQFRARYLARLSLTGFLGLGICVLLLAVLGYLCREVWEKETFQFDTTVLLWLHQWSNPFLDRLMLSITRLGNPEVVIVVVLVNLIWLLWRQYWFKAFIFMVACAGAVVLNQGLKLFFVRPRPVLWPALIHETSYGFPSGHALGSLVLYGFLAYLYAHWYPKYTRWIYGIATLMISLIGLSRLYLGVHYPTDVLAGFSIGFLWLMLCIVIMNQNWSSRRNHSPNA